jgi:selenocysteine-specific elongation factor
MTNASNLPPRPGEGRGGGAFVLGTAGHIDHGKSTLVKALTSIDPDRLEEEKRRGMTIDLGFAYLDLESGRRAAIVDVPGHQRFLKNMLAGVHGMDAVMLVIAADEGPMPQTHEHLAIIDLLQIRHGVVVLTKTDLVDPAWLELVRAEVAQLLLGTSLMAAPIVAVSSTTGQGIDALRRTLDDELANTESRIDLGRPRLPVDRSFAVAGFGTVVTGTLVGGTLSRGAEVTIWPSGQAARIRGLQQHNRELEVARPGTRAAVNLSGLDHGQLRRGDVLGMPGSLRVSRRLDARLVVLPQASAPLVHRQRLLLYHGTAEYMVELSLLEGDELRPGAAGLGQIFAEAPVVALDGDRFILRIPSPAETVAGGVILDIAPRRHRRRDRAVLDQLATRKGADLATAVVLELAKQPGGLTEGELFARLPSSKDQLGDVLSRLGRDGALHHVGSRWVTQANWEALARRITEFLEAYHRAHPLRRGMPREELRSKAGLSGETLAGVTAAMIAAGVVVETGAEVALGTHHQGLTPEQESAAAALLEELELQPFSPPPLGELLRRHGLTPALLQYLVSEGRVVRLNDDTVLARSAYDEAVKRLTTHLAEHRTLTVAAARDVLGSSRRYVLPLLEWLDAQKITRRVGDDRILRR